MNNTKPFASLSFDMDNQWSFMKTHGDPGWETFPSYLDLLIPRVLRFLKERNLTITFFVVGQDAALEKNQASLRSIVEAGHEIGNHSFAHEPWLHLYADTECEREIVRAEEAIQAVTGVKPVGFRGPGYSLSKACIQALIKNNYLYDASTLPTYLGPLCRAYYFMSAKMSQEEKKERALLFGTFQDGLRPNHPYYWRMNGGGSGKEILEIPVTTMPIIKSPFHVSYLLYLSEYSTALALLYFRIALGLCQLTGIQPSLLLHPLDFLGHEDVKELGFFPGMNLNSKRKIDVVDNLIDIYMDKYQVVTLQQHSKSLAINARSLEVDQHLKPRQEPALSELL